MALTDQLLCCLELNDGSGTNAADASGNGRVGTLTGGPTWIAGKVGSNAVSLAGDDDKIVIAHNAALSPTAITVALWINPDAWSVDSTSIASKQANSSPFPAWDFRKTTGAATLQAFCQVGASGTYTAVSPSNIVTGQWQHVAFTYDGTSLIVYRNGVAGTPVTNSGNPLSATTADLWIGGNVAVAGRYFDGAVDQFAVWGRALTPAELAGLWNAGSGLPQSLWSLANAGPPSAGGAGLSLSLSI